MLLKDTPDDVHTSITRNSSTGTRTIPRFLRKPLKRFIFTRFDVLQTRLDRQMWGQTVNNFILALVQEVRLSSKSALLQWSRTRASLPYDLHYCERHIVMNNHQLRSCARSSCLKIVLDMEKNNNKVSGSKASCTLCHLVSKY